jgi:hypothetical protein
LPRKASGHRRTPEPLIPLISDGLHFVREASPKDQHPMRFVIDQHKQVEHLPRFSTLPRHCESLEIGTDMMRRYTKRACQQSPELNRAFKSANGPITLPEPAMTDPDKPQRKPRVKAVPKPKKVEFPITRFTCCMANPVAQVWVCTKAKWEGIGVGRRSQTGRPASGDKLNHELGEFAVLRGDEPVLDAHGAVRVFTSLREAEGMMETLYDATPADEKMSDNNDPERRTTTVYQNRSYSVHFDPDYNGAKQPFNLFDVINFKVVLHPRGNFPLKYRSITGAIAEADRLDKVLRGV